MYMRKQTQRMLFAGLVGVLVIAAAPAVKADVVGPICETGDFIAKDRVLTKVNSGELLAVMSAGAYCFSMSSNYNSRTRAAEVMVKGKDSVVVRKRETFDDLTARESMPRALFSKGKKR